MRLALHLDDASFRKAGLATLSALRPLVERTPAGFATLLNASAYAEREKVVEIAIVGAHDAEGTRSLLASVRALYLPARVVEWFDPAAGPSDLPLLLGKTLSGRKPAAYVCRNYACDKPVTAPAALAKVLAQR